MISIILPSIHEKSFYRALKNIEDVTVGEYEVVAVTPFVVEREKVNWIVETTRLGSSGAQSYGVVFAKGKYIVALSDDVVLIRKGWDALAIDNFEKHSTRHFFGGGKGPFCLDMRLDSGGVNAIFGHTYATLPMMRRDGIAQVGWYDPIYFSRHGDSDLGLRIWESGGRVEWTIHAMITVHPDNVINGMTIIPNDSEQFRKRWLHKFPDWPDDPSKYDCGIAMDKIGYFPWNAVNIPKYVDYRDVRLRTGHAI